MDDSRGLLIALLFIVIVVAAVYYSTRPPPEAVEIVDLKIGGYPSKATATNFSYTRIEFGLKHNDGLNHTVTVLFALTTEGAHYVSITTAVGGKPLPWSGNSFRYNRPIFAADTYLSQSVFASAHMSGVRSVEVEITISLLVDNLPVGEAKVVTLGISV